MLYVGIIINRITWEVRQIINELESNQIKYELINNKKVYYKLSKVKDLKEKYDIILERSLSYLRGLYSCAVLEKKGYQVINNFNCLNISGNKLLTTLKLIENDIPTPDVCLAFNKESSIKAIEDEIKYPAIIKPIMGSWGRLIAKLDDHNNAISNLECRDTMGNIFQKIYYLQKFIPELDSSKPTDMRIFVIGDKCIAGMGRFHPEKDFRANLAIGGKAEPIQITAELEKISISASKAVDGEIVGVDIMEAGGKLYVIEVNGTPQFKGIMESTKVNIAKEIVDYILKFQNK